MEHVEIKEEIPEFIKQLTEGLSNHIKSASRYWLALAVVSLVTISTSITSITPDTSTGGINPKKAAAIEQPISLPFSLGKIRKNQFYPFSAALMSILIISFGSSHCQSIRSRKLINIALRDTKDLVKLPGGIDLRDAFEAISTNSINRTVPIAQLLLGKYQFYPDKENQPFFQKYLALIYHIVLKLITYLVVYVLPAYALFIAYNEGKLTLKTTNSTLSHYPSLCRLYAESMDACLCRCLTLICRKTSS